MHIYRAERVTEQIIVLGERTNGASSKVSLCIQFFTF